MVILLHGVKTGMLNDVCDGRMNLSIHAHDHILNLHAGSQIYLRIILIGILLICKLFLDNARQLFVGYPFIFVDAFPEFILCPRKRLFSVSDQIDVPG